MKTENSSKEKILVILTGGTICSTENSKGERSSDVKLAQYKITENFKASGSPFAEADFEYLSPMDILSENMTVSTWNTLLDCLKSTSDTDRFKGIIILHGTDTLAYTASLLSLTLTHLDIPVILVSSQLPLDEPETNGNANFRAAVELIMNGIRANVYAVYRNSDKKMYLHLGSQLKQCPNYSNDFFSHSYDIIENQDNANAKGIAFRSNSDILHRLEKLNPCVLSIVPFVGINYDCFSLNGISAVVHGTYHSESVCVERSKRQGNISNFSIIRFAERCRKNGVNLFLAPCNPDAYAYESTGDALDNGALPISGTTFEMAYVKTLLGCSMGLSGKAVSDFINTEINNEFIGK